MDTIVGLLNNTYKHDSLRKIVSAILIEVLIEGMIDH